jgi:signal transduction histidine kinase
MSDDGVTDLLEDRDGNIWVATRDGLNRLTPHKMTPIMDLGIVNAVDVTPEGRVWVGTADALVAFEGGTITSRSPPVVIPNPPLTAMHADDRGTLWIASADELSRIVRGRREVVPLRGNALRNLTDITSDGAGGLWLHDAELGLWNWRHGQLAPAAIPSSLQLVPLLASYTDRERRAWFAYQNGRVARIEPSGAVSVYGDSDGLTAGPYRSIHQDRAGAIWFGGNQGLSLFAHGEFRTLPPLMATALLPITGIVDDQSGNLWLALEGAGLLRLAGAELARALAEPGYRPRSTGYDKVDGSAGTSRWFGHRAAVRATDGRLWFVAGRGVTVVDPDVLDDATKPASPVRIEGAIVDGRRLSTASSRALPPRPARLQIDYTVLNLTSPLKTRYRHRLDGFDADWIDAGMNHSASYTHLPPRAYTFRVMATADDGSFSEPAAEWAFSIEPMFYQTWWFANALVGAIALAIGVAWRLHVLTVRRRFALLLGDRARLSREVHDTLLQSMFGFALQVDALGAAVANSAPELRSRLASLRHQVEEDIREARQSIWNLRSPKLEAQDLPSALKDAAEHAAASNGVRPVFAVSGAPRRAPPGVEEQLLRIGREAIANVVRHAHAHEMQVALQYDEDRITLRVRDDGQGFEPSAQSVMAEHFGLTTMRERAESVGGTLVVDAHPGTGTTVTVVIPDAHS